MLINKEGRRWWLDQKANKSLWEGEKEIFVSQAEAREKGWKIDAEKVIFFENPNEKNIIKIND